MLVAMTENEDRIYANEAKKTDNDGNKIKYYCPECGGELILRQGTKNIWHFSHDNGDVICHFRKGGGESYIHQLMKQTVKEIIERDNKCIISELEWKVGNRIADYYFEKKKKLGRKRIAVECVHKHTNIQEFRDKNEEYLNENVYVMWVFNLTEFLDKNNSEKQRKRINEIMREAHALHYGKVYAVNLREKLMYAVHFDNVKTYVEEYGEYGGYYKTLKSTKSCNVLCIPQFIVDSFNRVFDRKSLKFLPYPRAVANVYIEKWW